MSWWRWLTKDEEPIESMHLATLTDRIRAAAPGAAIPCTTEELAYWRKFGNGSLDIEQRARDAAQQTIIEEIFSIRVANNVPWKKLMEIALKHAPDETKAVLREINANDRAVSDLLAELAK